MRRGGRWHVVGPGPGEPDGAEPGSEDLLEALVLADLLAGHAPPVGRPSPAPADADEVQRLRAAVGQLEHALSARVTVERALGVLAVRSGSSPRAAFEQLRREARRSGRRVHELAAEVVASLDEDQPPASAPYGGR